MQKGYETTRPEPPYKENDMFEFTLFNTFKIVGLMVFATAIHILLKNEGPCEYFEDWATIIVMAGGNALIWSGAAVLIASEFELRYMVPIAAAILIIFNILITIVPDRGSLFGTIFGEDPHPGSSRHSTVSWNPTPQPQPAPERVVAFEAIDTGHQPFFHGTKSVDGAANIYYTGRWIVKDHEPHGIYVTTNIDTAIGYAGTDGRIIQLFVDEAVPLKKTADNCYAIELPKQKTAEKKPYVVEGVIPVALFDLTGRRLQSREGA